MSDHTTPADIQAFKNMMSYIEKLEKENDKLRLRLEFWEKNAPYLKEETLLLANAELVGACKTVYDNWDIRNLSCVVPKHHPNELAPNDSLAAGAIWHCIRAYQKHGGGK